MNKLGMHKTWRRNFSFIFMMLMLLALGSATVSRLEAADNEETLLSAREYTQMGIKFLEAGKYTEALRNFYRALEADTEYKDALYHIAFMAMKEQKWEAALPKLERCLELDPRFKEAKYGIGIYYYSRRQYANALTAFTQATEMDPYFGEAFYAVGITAMQLGDVARAVKSLETSVRTQSASADAHYQLGAVYAYQGFLLKSQNELSRAVAINPRLVELPPDLMVIFPAHSTRDANDPGRAVFLPRLPSHLLVRSRTGGAPSSARNRPDQVPGEYDYIPNWYLYYFMGNLLLEKKQYQTAKFHLTRALELRNVPAASVVIQEQLVEYYPYLKLATALCYNGEVVEAKDKLRIAWELNVAPRFMLEQLNAVLEEKNIKPEIALYPVPESTNASTITISGVVFNNFPIDKVTGGEISATLRAAGAQDLENLSGKPELPYQNRVYFELKDYPLKEIGENVIIIKAFSRGSERNSNLMEVSIIRRPPPAAASK